MSYKVFQASGVFYINTAELTDIILLIFEPNLSTVCNNLCILSPSQRLEYEGYCNIFSNSSNKCYYAIMLPEHDKFWI